MHADQIPFPENDDQDKPVRLRGTAIVIIAALLAAALKLYCATTTLGTNDVHLIFDFGREIYKGGLDAAYHSSVVFNHTPMTGSLFCLAYGL